MPIEVIVDMSAKRQAPAHILEMEHESIVCHVSDRGTVAPKVYYYIMHLLPSM